MVVEENSVKELPFSPTKKLFAVKQEVGLVFFLERLKLISLLLLQTNKFDKAVILDKYYCDITE